MWNGARNVARAETTSSPNTMRARGTGRGQRVTTPAPESRKEEPRCPKETTRSQKQKRRSQALAPLTKQLSLKTSLRSALLQRSPAVGSRDAKVPSQQQDGSAEVL